MIAYCELENAHMEEYYNFFPSQPPPPHPHISDLLLIGI